MIKFFRKIRQKLLSENKVSKYFLYAIGEIFLVVIGILIALQINNWNQYKKQEKKKIEITKSLILELNDVLKYTQKQVKLLDNRISLFTKVIHEWETLNPQTLSEFDLKRYNFGIHTATLIKYSPKTDYYNSLIGSGEIKFIPDSLSVKLNHVYNKERKGLITYVNQEVDLHLMIAGVVAKNHSKVFLTAKVTDNRLNSLDDVSIINFLNSIKTDGELKSLIIRNLTIIKWKEHLISERIIPELNALKKSLESNKKIQ